MYKKVLVPLDGSELAECVLPHVETIAGGCQVGNVTFVRVVEPFVMQIMFDSGYTLPQNQIEEIDAKNEAEAKRYLTSVMDRVKLSGISAEAYVIKGRSADSLVQYVEQNGIDLVIIATHGRSGLSRFVWG